MCSEHFSTLSTKASCLSTCLVQYLLFILYIFSDVMSKARLDLFSNIPYLHLFYFFKQKPVSEQKHIFLGCLLKNPWNRGKQMCWWNKFHCTVWKEENPSIRSGRMPWKGTNRLKAGGKGHAVDELSHQDGAALSGAEVLSLMLLSGSCPIWLLLVICPSILLGL
jgi:hypothetical protein